VSRQPPSGVLHVGNAEDDGVDYRGWFVGGFVKADDARATEDVEVKRGLHSAGDTRRAGWNLMSPPQPCACS